MHVFGMVNMETNAAMFISFLRYQTVHMKNAFEFFTSKPWTYMLLIFLISLCVCVWSLSCLGPVPLPIKTNSKIPIDFDGSRIGLLWFSCKLEPSQGDQSYTLSNTVVNHFRYISKEINGKRHLRHFSNARLNVKKS